VEDYTQTAVDATDDCTIWYVGDYLKKDASSYSTRIGASDYVAERDSMTSPLLGEFLGTMILILLGDGVVAAVLLKGSKAEAVAGS